MTVERQYPKVAGDYLYASEVTGFAGFGTGSDGAIDLTTGSIVLHPGSIYHYSSFNLGANAKVVADGSPNYYPLVIYVQGNCTIAGSIDLLGKGLAGGGIGANGTGYSSDIYTGGGVGAAATANEGTQGYNLGLKYNSYTYILNGTGGGGGASNGYGQGGGGGVSSNSNGTCGGVGTNGDSSAGKGGYGGCSLFIVCGGNLITSGRISTQGEPGQAGWGANSNGGGGGGGGDIIILYDGTYTSGGVFNTSGGDGGTNTGAGGGGGNGGTGLLRVLSHKDMFWGK